MHLIFAYGSLKRGFARNHLLRDQRYIGIARTKPIYTMYGYGGFPALVDDKLAEASSLPAANKYVYGELYEVDDACIQELDKIEGTDRGFFERHEVALGEITMTSLPFSEDAWGCLTRKVAQTYFFQKKLTGAGDCGSVWFSK
jgi:gamma-glutamylaminecyclotransferase